MSNKQQTAIDWLVEKLKSQGLLIGEPDNLIAVKQAKELEKQQIIDANNDGQSLHAKSVTKLMIRDNAENYHEQTYG